MHHENQIKYCADEKYSFDLLFDSETWNRSSKSLHQKFVRG